MKKELSANIPRYYWFQFFIHFTFYTPVFILFMVSRGLSLTDVGIIQSTHSTGALLMELPGGIVADRFTKKSSLILGSFLWALALMSYVFCVNLWQFALAAFIGGIGQAFLSGADRALIYESLHLLGRVEEYKKIEGRVRGMNEFIGGVGVFLGGIIGAISLALTLIVSSFMVVVSTVISTLFVVPSNEEKIDKPSALQIGKESLKVMRTDPQILWLTIYFAVFIGALWTVALFPQPYLKMLNVPTALFGVIFAAFSLISAISSFFVHKLDRHVGKRLFIAMGLLVVVSLLAMGSILSLYTFLLWFVFEAFGAINWTLVSSEVLKLIPKNQATTVLSFQSLMVRLVNVVFSPIMGFAADNFGLLHSFQFTGLLLSMITILLIVNSPSFRS